MRKHHKPFSEETKQKMRKPKSEEHKKKLSILAEEENIQNKVN